MFFTATYQTYRLNEPVKTYYFTVTGNDYAESYALAKRYERKNYRLISLIQNTDKE
jgi:hypothetical protein